MLSTGMRDFDVHREILSELDWTQQVHSTEVGVQVSSGVVTLSGRLSSVVKVAAAIDAAHRVEGVRAVVDAMTVPAFPSDTIGDVDVARNAANVLESLGREYIDDMCITVEDGVVTLDGQVRKSLHRDKAEQLLRELPGVRDVDNRINVAGAMLDMGVMHASIEGSFLQLAAQAARRISIDVSGPQVVLRGTVGTWAERDQAERAARAAGAFDLDNQIQVYPHTQVPAETLVYIAG